MATPETKFVGDVRKALESMGARVFKVWGNAVQESGWPDLQVYHPAWTGHIEVKWEDGPVSAIQQIVLRDLNRLGTPAVVLRGFANGEVRLASSLGRALGKIVESGWKIKMGTSRGRMLLELLKAGSDEMRSCGEIGPRNYV